MNTTGAGHSRPAEGAPVDPDTLAAGGTRGRAREEAILAAAGQLVGEVGYDRVTVDAIAARARASKATMYRRWPGKAELVASALRHHAQGTGAATVPDTGSLRGDLLAAARDTTRAIAGTGGPSLLGLVEAVRDDAALRRQVRAQIEDASAGIAREICDRAAARGELAPDTDGSAVLTLAVAQLFLTTLLSGEPPGEDDRARLVDTVLLPLLGLPHRH